MGGIGLMELLVIAAMIGVPLLVLVAILLAVASRRPRSDASRKVEKTSKTRPSSTFEDP